MHRTTSAGLDGGRWPVARQAAVMRAGMSPGARNSGASMSTTAASPGASAAAASSCGRSERDHVRSVSDSTHRPITLRRNRIVPSTPPSLVKFAASAASPSSGSGSSSPASDQVPQEM